MERVAGKVDGSHLEIGNLDAFGIFLFVQLGAHLEAGIGCRRGDQLDDRAIATQWFSPPEAPLIDAEFLFRQPGPAQSAVALPPPNSKARNT